VKNPNFKPNVKLLRRIKKLILANPNLLDMQLFMEKVTPDKHNICGTTACIAGWTCILEKEKLPVPQQIKLYKFMQLEYFHNFSFHLNGAKLLNITNSQANRLFFLHKWPEQFRVKYDEWGEEKGYVERNAEVTAKRIEYFIKHGV